MGHRGVLRFLFGRPCHRRRRRTFGVLSLLLLIAGWPAATGAATAKAAAATAAPSGVAVAVIGFILPVAPPPMVLTAFKPPTTRFGAGHRGVDLSAPTGSMVQAAGNGRVVFAGALAGRGVVSIEHAGGLRTTYEPVTASVAAGATVQPGQHIGDLEPGHPGCAPASCLHWGARLPDRTYLDPMSLLAPWRVRLLPWDGR